MKNKQRHYRYLNVQKPTFEKTKPKTCFKLALGMDPVSQQPGTSACLQHRTTPAVELPPPLWSPVVHGTVATNENIAGKKKDIYKSRNNPESGAET